MKHYNYIITTGGTKKTRTNDAKKAQKKIAELQAANEKGFSIKNYIDSTITTYWKESYQKNYRTKTVKFETKTPLQGK